MVIPAQAFEAAVKVFAVGMWGRYDPEDVPRISNAVREMLEAAAPYMLAPIARLADEWHEQGEELMADSKTLHMDEGISVELLKEGATMVENARHIRNAIAGNS